MKRNERFCMMAKLIVLSVMLMLFSNIQAQATPVVIFGTLIYERSVGQSTEIVALSANQEQTYSLPQDKCTAVSPNGIYTAQSSIQEDNLIIQRLDNQAIIIQTAWSTDWEPCYIFWRNDNQLYIAKRNSPQEFFNFDISSGDLIAFTFLPMPSPQYPSLPGWLIGTKEDFILPSPDENIFLYQKCSGQTIGSNQDQSCLLSPSIVIYNAQLDSVLHVLDNPSANLSGSFNGISTSSCGAVAWSTDGRLLAFESNRLSPYQQFNLQVYDLSSLQYLDTSFLNTEIDSCKGFHWSPEGHILAFWINGSLDSNILQAGQEMLRTLIFFSADSLEFIVSDTSYPMELFGNIAQFWSPDGQGLAFIDLNHNLVYVDAITGESVHLDSSVTKILTWKPNNIPMPTPTVTSTVFPTPTSIPTQTPIPSPFETSTATSNPTLTETPLPTLTPPPVPAAAILFTSERDGNHEIYSMAADGSNVVRLTNSSGIDFYPTWFPDHSKIAFASTRNGNLDVYTMLADGSNVTQLTTSGGDDYGAQVSPDGTQMLFVSSRDGNLEIYGMNVDGTNQVRLTDNTVVESIPSWSPDGSKISFASFRDNNMELYTANPDGSNPTRLTNNSAQEYGPSWSPDGTRLAFVSTRDGNMEIYVMNVDGSNLTRLTTNSASDGFAVVGGTAYYGLSWSPDSSQLVFLSDRDGNVELYKMNADGTNPTRLTNASGVDSFPDW